MMKKNKTDLFKNETFSLFYIEANTKQYRSFSIYITNTSMGVFLFINWRILFGLGSSCGREREKIGSLRFARWKQEVRVRQKL